MKFKTDISRLRAELLVAELVDRVYAADTTEITYPCIDGSMYTLEIPTSYKLDAIEIARRSNDYQKAYGLDMAQWRKPGAMSLVVTTRYGNDYHLFIMVTGPARGTIVWVSEEEAQLLKLLDIVILESPALANANGRDTNIVNFPLRHTNSKV